MKAKSKKVIKVTVGTLSILCLLGFALGLGIYGIANAPEVPFGPPSVSKLGKYETAAVSSDGVPCSAVGRDVLVEGGNAVDAAIATLFCIGAVNPQSAGIGGGSFMTIYDPVTKIARSLDAREVAPLAATENMFNGNSSISQKGGLAVAVPGELAGYWEAHQMYGKLPWSRLILPTVILAEAGVAVNGHLANALQEKSAEIKAEPSMWYFLNEETGEVKTEGEIFKRPAFAETLKEIAQFGVEAFYNGTIGDRLVEDIRKRKGIITKEDLLEYRAEWVDPVRVELNDGLVLYSMPPPGSGVLAAYIMNILDGYVPQGKHSKAADTESLTYHRMAEAFKHAYAQRTKLADPRFEPQVYDLAKNLTSEQWASDTRAKINDEFTYNDPAFYGAVTYNPDDKGTSHVSIIDANGMAVSATSTVNLYFGAGFTSEQTGIILNDEMDDFSSPNVTNAFGVPPSPANFIKPGKRPLSSMTPTIIVDSDGKVRSVVGAAGGTKITTATVYTIIQNLWFGKNIKESIDRPRIHHQLFPMTFQYETGFPEFITKDMVTKNHTLSEYPVGGAVVCGISIESDGYIYANSDFRKGGDVAGIDPIE